MLKQCHKTTHTHTHTHQNKVSQVNIYIFTVSTLNMNGGGTLRFTQKLIKYLCFHILWNTKASHLTTQEYSG